VGRVPPPHTLPLGPTPHQAFRIRICVPHNSSQIYATELTANAFNRLDQYASSPGNRTYCYLELAVSSLAVAETIASTHCAYPRRDDQAELAWVAGYIPVIGRNIFCVSPSKAPSTPATLSNATSRTRFFDNVAVFWQQSRTLLRQSRC